MVAFPCAGFSFYSKPAGTKVQLPGEMGARPALVELNNRYLHTVVC